MPRRFLGVGAAFVVLLVALLAARLAAVSPPRQPAPAPAPAPDPDPPTPDADRSRAALWRARAARLSERCDVPTHTVCSSTACATVASIPDLDSPRGWLALGWRNPGVLTASVLGDLGLEPPGGWPCHDAIERLVRTAATGVAVGDGPRGTWVVCAAGANDRDATDTLCARAAAPLGLPWTGGDPDHRL